MKVFEIMRAWADEPVTVFAETPKEARAIYNLWLEAHHWDRPARPIGIYAFDEDLLRARPVLANAAKQNIAGVGYWNRARERWVIVRADATPAGDLVEPEPRVAYYRVEADEGDAAMVFAESVEHAVTLYCFFHLDRWGQLPARFSTRKMSRWELLGEFASLRDDMHADISGVARKDVNGDWRILPPG